MAHVKDGKVIKAEGDPNSPISHGTLCSKGLAITQLAYHPDRIFYPMKRTGAKREGKWGLVSWNKALDEISPICRQSPENTEGVLLPKFRLERQIRMDTCAGCVAC
jgi:anaerobic selenocysteine-containing dehydrogenase